MEQWSEMALLTRSNPSLLSSLVSMVSVRLTVSFLGEGRSLLWLQSLTYFNYIGYVDYAIAVDIGSRLDGFIRSLA